MYVVSMLRCVSAMRRFFFFFATYMFVRIGKVQI